MSQLGAKRDIGGMRSLAALLGPAACALGIAAALGAQSPTVSRRDLADAYLQIDRLAARRGIPAARRTEWNQAFDRTTLAFFGGDYTRVLREMHDLLARMSGDSAVGSPTRQVLQLRAQVQPYALIAGRGSAPELQLTLMYPDPALGTRERVLQWRIVDAGGVTRASGEQSVLPDLAAGTTIAAALPAGSVINAPGKYRVEVSFAGAALGLRADFLVLGAPAERTQAELQRAIAALPASTDAHDVAAMRARAALVTEAPDPGNSAAFLANQVTLANDVRTEIRTAAAGQRPFAFRTGDYWRVILGPAGPIPMRIYAPRDARAGVQLPVVIAFHGAGADENMFFEGYGAGRLRQLADSVGFLLVSPLTIPFVQDAAALDSTLAVLQRDYLIDRATVYVLGHSLGGAAAWKAASERRSAVRAAAVIAPAVNAPASSAFPATLIVGAEADLVIPITRVRVTYEQASAAGAAVEFSLAEGWGHTLVVGARLDDVVRWLFRH